LFWKDASVQDDTRRGKIFVLVVEKAPLSAIAGGPVEDAGLEALHAANADEAVRIWRAMTISGLSSPTCTSPDSSFATAIRDSWPAIKPSGSGPGTAAGCAVF
jgi:hypothetical protein